ncbi:hypothetical protein CRUP_016630, partial [Coryphaenoides rupestris]
MTVAENPVETFTTVDYVVFALLFVVSSGIGIFFAVKERKADSSKDFLVGGRQMTCVPVALSLTASFMSAVTVLGSPADVYRFGASFILYGVAYSVTVVATAELFVPVFYTSGITSTYEYLELRFCRGARLTSTLLYILQTILYTGVVVYAPALALNQVTGFNLWGSIFATGLVCTFYCTLTVGGVVAIRHTFWTLCIGGSFTWLGIYGVNQSVIQRCISCKTKTQARLALYLNLLGLLTILCMAVFCGLIMYAHYAKCDPWTAGRVTAPDQVCTLCLYEAFIIHHHSGAIGGFIAGIALAFWAGIGSFIYPAPDINSRPLPLITDGCPWPPLADSWYSLSYLYLSAVGFTATLTVGLVITSLTGCNKDKDVDPLLVRPLGNLFCFWSEKGKRLCWGGAHPKQPAQGPMGADTNAKDDGKGNNTVEQEWLETTPKGLSPNGKEENCYSNA